VLINVRVKKKKLSTHFKIQAYYTKTYVLTNKAAEEIIFLYNTKNSVFIFILEFAQLLYFFILAEINTNIYIKRLRNRYLAHICSYL